MKNYFSLLLLFSYASATLAATPLKTDFSAGFTYDDNVTRAERSQDIEKDSILSVDASASQVFSINEKSFFSVKGTLGVNQYLDFSELSNVRLGIHGGYHLRPSAGYTAIRYLAQLSYEQRLYSSSQREGSAILIQLGLSKRISDAVSMRAGFIKEDISGGNVVFDADNNRLYLDLDFKLNQKNTLYTTLGYMDGDLVTIAPVLPQLQAEYTYWIIDDAFTDLPNTRWAYRLTGSAISLKLGDSYMLSSNEAIDASVQYYDAESDGSSSYSGLIYSASYLHRF